MRLTTIGLCAFVAACGSRPAAPSHGDADAAIVSQACLSSRAARAKAAELDHGGHELLALAKLDEANASCPAERSTTLPLESTLLANTNNCTRLRALDGASKEGKSTCDALEAPSKGTEASMRAKM